MIGMLDHFRELNTFSVLLRLVLAVLLGGLIGLERGRKRRPAGFRTYLLVCLGAALTMLLGQYYCVMMETEWAARAAETGVGTDISRFGAQVVSGVGFLGAGTILITGRQEVKGLTTAAGMWASACMGLAIGAGFYECVVLAFVLILCSMRLLPLLESRIIENTRNMQVYVEFDSVDAVGDIIGCIKRQNIHIFSIELDRGGERGAIHPSVVFAIRLSQRQDHARVLTALAELECVFFIEEI